MGRPCPHGESFCGWQQWVFCGGESRGDVVRGGGVEGGLGMRLGDLRQRNSGSGRGSAKRQRGKARHVVTMQRGGGGVLARVAER
jgi:hypothetical protein